VLDDVEAGAFEEHPAREHAPVLRRPALADVDLHEGAGLLRHFPGRGALAGGHAHDHRPHLARLAGLEAEFFGDVVALVEQAEHRDPLVHRGRAVIIGGRSRGGGSGRGGRILERNLDRLTLGRGEIVARRKEQRQDEDEGPHAVPQLSAAPGVQAS
jgi:hypothetical protein